MKIVFRGTVEHGALKIYNPDFISFLRQFEGKVLFLTIQPEKRPRSLPQNRLYWEWLGIIGNTLGYTREEMHDTFKAMFLTDHGARLPVVRSTTGLTTKEFSEYMGKVDRQAAELGISLPTPEEIEA